MPPISLKIYMKQRHTNTNDLYFSDLLITFFTPILSAIIGPKTADFSKNCPKLTLNDTQILEKKKSNSKNLTNTSC